MCATDLASDEWRAAAAATVVAREAACWEALSLWAASPVAAAAVAKMPE